MQWAFMTANYVGRALGYANNTDWMANHRATVEAFHGPQFGARFAEMIDDITAAGFDAIELWVAHLDPLLDRARYGDHAKRADCRPGQLLDIGERQW